jgi:hypothetical protein
MIVASTAPAKLPLFPGSRRAASFSHRHVPSLASGNPRQTPRGLDPRSSHQIARNHPDALYAKRCLPSTDRRTHHRLLRPPYPLPKHNGHFQQRRRPQQPEPGNFRALAYDSGDLEENLTTIASGAKIISKGSYIIIFKSQPNRGWKIVQHVWTGNLPPGT